MTENELLRRCKAVGLPDDWANGVLSKAKRLDLLDELYVDTLIADAVIRRDAGILSAATKDMVALRESYTVDIARAVAETVEPQVAKIARLAIKDVLASPARMARRVLLVVVLLLAVGPAAFTAGLLSFSGRLDALEPSVSGEDGPVWATLLQLNPDLPRYFSMCLSGTVTRVTDDSGNGCKLPVYVERSDIPKPLVVQYFGTIFWLLNQTMCLAACGLIYLGRTPLKQVWAKVKRIN